MKRFALLFFMIYLFTCNSFAKNDYKFLNLKGEVDLSNNKLIHISWENNDEFYRDLNEGKIKDAFVEFDVKLDQGKYLSERNKDVFRVNAIDKKITINSFLDKQELNTENTLVSVRLRYVYKSGESIIEGDYIEPIVLGYDSFIRNVSNWSKKEFDIANKMGLVLNSFKDDVRRPISRYEFIKMLMKLNNYIGKEPDNNNLHFEDIDDKDINSAYNLGIINGINGNLFAGDKNLSKEEMATIIHRYFKVIDFNLKNDSNFYINDIDSVSIWAKESVISILKAGIIKGDGNRNSNPKKDVTCEEAVVMIVRLLELVN